VDRLKKYFLTGLAFLVPIALTAWVLFNLFVFFDNIIGRFVRTYAPILAVPGFGLVALIALILVVGFIGSNWLGSRLLQMVDRSLAHTPFLSKLFLFVKGLTSQIFTRKRRVFQRVVRVKMWSGYTYGFVTGSTTSPDGERWLHILVPTVPNVSSGFYLMIPEEDACEAGLSVEEALKVVISAGIFQPGHAANTDRSDRSEEHSVPRDQRSS